jgi:hypothetical protein
MMSVVSIEHAARLLWTEFRAPIVALAVTASCRLAGRPALSAAAGGVGAACGWWLLFGLGLVAFGTPADRLAIAAAIVAAAAAAGAVLRWRQVALALPVLAALLCGWWLAGAPGPHRLPPREVIEALAIAAGIAAAAWLARGDAWRIGGAALGLWGALRAAEAPVLTASAALVPLAAAVALLGGGMAGAAAPAKRKGARRPAARTAAPGGGGMAGFAPVATVMAAGSVAVLSVGRLPYGRFGAVDAAALSPLLVLWLTPRFRRFGRLFAALLAATIGVAVTWVIARTMTQP